MLSRFILFMTLIYRCRFNYSFVISEPGGIAPLQEETPHGNQLYGNSHPPAQGSASNQHDGIRNTRKAAVATGTWAGGPALGCAPAMTPQMPQQRSRRRPKWPAALSAPVLTRDWLRRRLPGGGLWGAGKKRGLCWQVFPL